MFSSILVVGLARVSIFQFMSTEERSPILTCRIDSGHGSANIYGSGSTSKAPVCLVNAEDPGSEVSDS